MKFMLCGIDDGVFSIVTHADDCFGKGRSWRLLKNKFDMFLNFCLQNLLESGYLIWGVF